MSLEAIASGSGGFSRLSSGDTGSWAILKAINGDVTFGTGCEVSAGDAPANGDVLQQGDWIVGTFTKVVFSGGVLLGYGRDIF